MPEEGNAAGVVLGFAEEKILPIRVETQEQLVAAQDSSADEKE